jgi:predicted dehydrogenase
MAAENIELVALGDMFEDRLKGSRAHFATLKHPGVKITDEKCFVGWDAYRRVIDAGVDLVLFATPPGFRPMHVEAAVEAGRHVFMEKPVAVDPVGVRRIIAAGEKAKEKKLGVLSGTQYRHHEQFVETVKRIHEGAIGTVLEGYAYYNTGALWNRPRKAGESDMEWQLRNWYYFDWLSGDFNVEQHIHTIDVTDWAMNARPVRAVATGGRQVRTEPLYGNIYDHFAVDYEYPGGAHVLSMCRQWANTHHYVGAIFVGTKGRAMPYEGVIEGENPWKYPGKATLGHAYVQEHADLIASLRAGNPINEARQVAESTLTAILGRHAAYTGKVVTRQEMERSLIDYRPPKYEFGPLPPRPVPQPGQS